MEGYDACQKPQSICARLGLTYSKLVIIPHQGIVQQMPVNLGLDQDEVDEEDDEVMLDVFVAKPAAILAHRQPDIVPAGLVAGALSP